MGNPKSEAKNLKSEATNPKSNANNPKSDAKNPKLFRGISSHHKGETSSPEGIKKKIKVKKEKPLILNFNNISAV